MNIRIVAAAVTVMLSVTGAPANAAQDTNAALLACANESDDAQRLRCFDALTANLRRAPAAPVAAAASAPSPSPAPAPAPAVVASNPPSPASAEARFGARGELKPDHHDKLSELTATVTEVGAKPHGELIVTLDNGQMWAEIATGSRARVKQGDTVTIQAGTLGSFVLIAANGRSTKVARIR